MSTKSDSKDSFSTKTVATTVVQSKDGTQVIKNTTVSPTDKPGSPLKVTTTRNEALPHRTPIEEASLPQPRPAGVVDTDSGSNHLLESVAERISRAVTSVKEGAEGVSEKLKSVGATVAQKTDEATAAAARTTASAVNVASESGNTMEKLSKKKEKRAKEWNERAKEHDEKAHEHYVRAKQPFNYSNGSRPANWTDEDEAILLRIRRDINNDTTQQKAATPASRYQSSSLAQPLSQMQKQHDEHEDEHHGALQTIKDWFTGRSHDDEAAKMSDVSMGGWRSSSDKDLAEKWRDFDEGADMAKREAFLRLQRIARDTENKIDAARRAADQWDHEAREQVMDAWENARTHSQQLIRDANAKANQPPMTGESLVRSLQRIKQENSRLKIQYMRDLCERHPDRGQCYDSMKRITGLAKENTRIKVALADKNLKSH